MKTSLSACLILAILVISSIFIAGCSDTPADSSSTEPVVTTASITALYAAGDIVKNPQSSSTAGLLILGYDAGTDTYERAYIYPNTDGSWGYRLDSKTEQLSRSTIETLYTEKSGTIEVSAVPVGKPTTIATTTATTKVTTATTVATTTTSSAAAPRISDITPAKGATGTTVSITALEGKNFVSGANVTLAKKGETSIAASSVSVTSSELITCKFAIPSDAGTGFWDVVIKNPDGQSYTYGTSFTVTKGDSSATDTSTTSSITSTRNPESISSVLTNLIRLGPTINSQKIEINGVNLTCTSGDVLRLVSSSHTLDSQSGTYYCTDTRTAAAYFTIPTGYQGTYDVQIVDSKNAVVAIKTSGLVIGYT